MEGAARNALLFLKMYSLIIPHYLLKDLAELRDVLGVSIRGMILRAVEQYIEQIKTALKS